MKILATPCPYCQSPTMPAPDRRGVFVYTECPACGARPMASFSDITNPETGRVKTQVTYVRTRGPGRFDACLNLRIPSDLKAKCDARGPDWIRRTLADAE